MNISNNRVFPGLLLLLYLTLGCLFAVNTPAWQAPDEPAHYNYVRYLAEKGAFPVLHMGDYPHAYLEQIKAAHFPPDMSIAPIRYEFHQPPLYYALLAPVFALAHGSLLALRLASVALGAGIVSLAWLIGRRVFPGRPGPALGAAAFVAFLPQHLATVSQVGNDVLAELLFAAVLLVLVGWVQEAGDRGQGSGDRGQEAGDRGQEAGDRGQEAGDRGQEAGDRGQESKIENQKSKIENPKSVLSLGILLGLILITKTTAYLAFPLAAGVFIWRWWRERAAPRRIAAEGALLILPAALIALPWYARNIAVYGWPDFLGLQRHDAIVVGQMRLAEYVAQNGWAAYWQRAVEWTFKSFVGVFGWMGAWLDSRVYFALALLGGITVSGCLVRAAYYVLRIPYSEKTMDSADNPHYASDPQIARSTQYALRSTQYALRSTQYASDPQIARSTQYASDPQIARSTQAIRRSPAVRLLALSALLTFLIYAWYNTQFLQHQGRYLFTALIPIALAFAVGWERVVQPGVGRWLAAALVVYAAGLAAWGGLTGVGLPKWPVAITAAAAAGVLLLDLALTLLERSRRRGREAAEGVTSLLRAAALMFPYAFLALIALYALLGVIVPQLTL